MEEWSDSRCLIPGERTTGTHWIRGWVGHKACMNTEAKKN